MIFQVSSSGRHAAQKARRDRGAPRPLGCCALGLCPAARDRLLWRRLSRRCLLLGLTGIGGCIGSCTGSCAGALLGIGRRGFARSIAGVCAVFAIAAGRTVPAGSRCPRTTPGTSRGRRGRRSGRRCGTSPGCGAAGAPGARRTAFFCRVSHRLRYSGAHALDYRIGHHAGQSPAQAVPSDGRIQPNAGHDTVRLSRHPGDADNEQHPGQNAHIGGHMPHGRDEQLQKNHVQHHHQAHGAEHPAPALENIRRVFTAAGGKGQRGQHDQHRRHHIPLGNLEKALDELPHDDEIDDDDQEPGCPNVKVVFIGEADGDAVGDLEQINGAGGYAQPDVADLTAGQEQEAEHKGPHKQQLRVFSLKAQAGHHAFGGLKNQIAQQQRPARRDDDGNDFVCHRSDPAEIVQVHGENVQQGVCDVLDNL